MYQMSMNVLPKEVKRKLNGIFNHFLWDGSEEKEKMHLVGWELMARLTIQGRFCVLDL